MCLEVPIPASRELQETFAMTLNGLGQTKNLQHLFRLASVRVQTTKSEHHSRGVASGFCTCGKDNIVVLDVY